MPQSFCCITLSQSSFCCITYHSRRFVVSCHSRFASYTTVVLLCLNTVVLLYHATVVLLYQTAVIRCSKAWSFCCSHHSAVLSLHHLTVVGSYQSVPLLYPVHLWLAKERSEHTHTRLILQTMPCRPQLATTFKLIKTSVSRVL